MDDSCAVCADALEWVAYGPCGHRDVCSTCVARLRFICNDRRCCICKTECDFVFVTKALGDYTRMVNDFSTFPSQVREGQVGSYWYHEDTQAFFDDAEHYKMIKAMCRLSCGVCDKMEDQQQEGGFRRRQRFKNIGQLKGHLSHQHRMYMCDLCLEGRKTHFRHDHYLCEDEGCLAKKFIVFQSEAELKRHNAVEHGGRMSRSKRNAVLQIPTSFRYRSNYESGHHRGRRRTFRREPSPDNELNMAIQASLEGVNAGGAVSDPSLSSVAAPPARDDAGSNDVEPLVQPFESLSTSDSEPSSRYRQAVSQSTGAARLGESSFPPLSAAASSQQKSQQELDALNQNTMAARLRRQNNATVLNVARPSPARNRGPVPASSGPWPAPARLTSSGQIKQATAAGSGSSSCVNSLQARLATEPGLAAGGAWGVRNPGSSSTLNHSSSAPNLVESRSFDPVSDFPRVSAVQSSKLQNSGQTVKTEDANKSLVDKIRAGLDFDENKYNAFKEISQEYRHGVIDTWEYLEYVKQFDLTHLVLDLARLCPDSKKQRELIEAYNATQNGRSEETFWGNGSIQARGSSSSSRKDKGKKAVGSENSHPKEALVDSIISTVRSLQSQVKPPAGEVEVLEKDGYRTSKGKSTVTIGEKLVEMPQTNQHLPTQPTGSAVGRTSGDGAGGSKQKKKTSKFQRVRLGDASPAAVLDVTNSTGDPSPAEVGANSGWPNPSEGLSTRGVWRKGGGQRLFAK
ncbi:hypothetical protein Cgig2_019329 [Carnegiea gigantea]|uniref:RING-type domain-containing protein n=1 Tax=Carnegiea gigantea TaxID=171969 RepID=A0A9Q1KPF0_9CARY|nr:hypothetical protein Cgig2_019329 [Carnegiea gigantea]